jgi:hypothetical protein
MKKPLTIPHRPSHEKVKHLGDMLQLEPLSCIERNKPLDSPTPSHAHQNASSTADKSRQNSTLRTARTSKTTRPLRVHILRKLPPVATVHALAKRGHRFIGRPRLRLAVRHHFLLALAALELLRDTLLDLCDHGLVHVLLLQLLVFEAARVRLHLVVCHDDELRG